MKREEIEAVASDYIKTIGKEPPHEIKKFARRLRDNTEKYVKLKYRRLVVVSGGDEKKQGFISGYITYHYLLELSRLRGGKKLKLLYMYHDEYEEARIRKETFRQFMKMARKKLQNIERNIDVYEKSDRYLGTSYDVLILDLTNDLRPNDIGKLVEIVNGGGLIIFLTPDLEKWDRWMTAFKQKLVVPGFNEPRHIFIRWFKETILDSDSTYVYDAEKDQLVKKFYVQRVKGEEKKSEVVREKGLKEKHIFDERLYSLALTEDQQKVLEVMEELLGKMKKKKVLVITSNRGRGKSSVLGIGVIALANHMSQFKHKVRILVTAPEITNVQSLFDLAYLSAKSIGLNVKLLKKGGMIIEIQGQNFSIEYWEPINIPKIKGDVVVVDEASGISVPLLLKILKTHKRLIFSATIHGYEGAGRGFSVRFLGSLRKDPNVELSTCEMKTPIRYGEGDPIEKWLYRALLLDAEPTDLSDDDLTKIKNQELEYVYLDPAELFKKENEELLRQLFGIFVLAHYRNQPDDLAMMADAPHHMIRAVMIKGTNKIVCSLQIAVEGGLDSQTVDTLLRGNKIQGNIIPDRIIKHLRIWEMGWLRGYRIVRIATHPEVQNLGIGSFALERLYEEARQKSFDWIGSGFGANYSLLNFWIKNKFIPVHISPDKNPISGEYTVIVIRPINHIAEKITREGQIYLRKKIVKGMRDVYKEMEQDLALLILNSIEKMEIEIPKLHPIDVDRLWIYVYGPMTYEAISDVFLDLAIYYFLGDMEKLVELNNEEKIILLAKVLQGKDWSEMSKMLRRRRIDLMLILKDIAKRMLNSYYNKNLESSVGYHI
ncbi:tRNA(Met) cytidine acetyltransferase TmcA [Fervidicoccus sp.]|uniref:tRNA(Met) cytidine acetyltransferase TmcA n=1 Tax=Fervidicoccus sp. TaxID=2060324 RepID=UPI003D0FDF52